MTTLKLPQNILTFLTCCAVLLSTVASLIAAPTYSITEVMSGLVSPRGLVLGPDGAVYVAEAGSGGSGPSVTLGNGNIGALGFTSGLSKLLNGVQTRVLSGLPSVATAAGLDASGLQDIAFDRAGQAYGLFGLGTDAAQRDANLGAVGAVLGTIARLQLANSNTLVSIADISAHEFANNPAGGTIDSNPFGLAIGPNSELLVADAGANDFLNATSTGTISTLAILPARPNPLPFGPPVFQSVPTAITVGPDGAYYIGQLTGFPFPAGAANVYRFDPTTSDLSIAHSGFTNIVDLTFDENGNLFVLQLTTNGIASSMGPGAGALFKVDSVTGARELVASEGLVFPGSVAAGANGVLYVSNHANTPLGGQVLQLTPVPEPKMLVQLALCAVLSGCSCLRRCGQRWR